MSKQATRGVERDSNCQRCMRILGAAGPLQNGHRSTRSTHAPQTAWPQSTKATDFDAEQHSAHWDASSPQRARSTTWRFSSSPRCWTRVSSTWATRCGARSSTGSAAATRRPSARSAARLPNPLRLSTAATPSAARASSASTGALFVEGRRSRRSAYTSEFEFLPPVAGHKVYSTSLRRREGISTRRIPRECPCGS